MKKIISIILFLICWSVPCSAANWYVLKSASGSNDGTDWTNAWHEMEHINWAGISAGDTVWLGGGTYTTQLFPQTLGTSENRVYVKRVRTTDTAPAAAAGWNASFDSQVIINYDAGAICVGSSGSYTTIDGRIESGIKASYTDASWSSCALWLSGGVTGVVVQYCELAGPGGATAYNHTQDVKTIQIRNPDGTPTDITIRYCKVYGGVDQVMILGLDTGLFEHNEFYYNETVDTETYHPGTIACRKCYNTITFRFNKLYSSVGEGILLGADSGDVACTWDIYGNIMWGGKSGYYRFLELQYKDWLVHAYNNTIADVWNGFRAIAGGTFAEGSSIQNNILYDVTTPFNEGTTGIHDYNALSGTNSETNGISNMPSSAFTDYANQDFTIVGTVSSTYPRDKGVALGSSYNTDRNGISRPQGLSWDIGAYEFEVSSGTYPAVKLGTGAGMKLGTGAGFKIE